jgi:uncharacterized protein with HEPN domain/predicted nucleotidyltransferase
MQTLTNIKAQILEHQHEWIGKYPIQKLSIFGSYARNEQNKDSDLDVLVSLDEKIPIGLEFVSIALDIEDALGLKIDLVTENGLHPKIKKYVYQDLICMFNRDYKILIEEILESIEKISQYTQGMTLDELKNDSKTTDTVLRNLGVISEAANRIPEDIKKQYAHIAWRQIIGLRNMIIHKYFRVDMQLVWNVIHSNLPEIKTQLAEIQ